MELKEINKKEYLDYALKNKYISIYQLPEWGDLKSGTGWKHYLVGLYDKNVLKGVSLLLEKRVPLKLSLFYAPRGFLIDVEDKELLTIFTKEVEKFINKHHGFMLKVDPNVIYALYDSEGNDKKVIGEKVFKNFVGLKYKHLGFTKNFETMQPRFLCRFKLNKNYNDTLSTFSKSTRKNIEKTLKMGVKTREVGIDEIDLFVSLLQETASNKKFVIRPVSYYKKMYELMNDYIKLYVTYIDTNEYYKYALNEIEVVEKEISNLKKQMSKCNVGSKLKTALAQNENKLTKLKVNLTEALDLKKINDQINIGALMSIFIGDEGITFMSGTSNIYKNFNPKYAFYNEHILKSIEKGMKYVNFYGISGDLNPKSEYYSIYEIKKGFNPEVIELVGEFDLITNRFGYWIYKIALKGYKILKMIKK